MTGKRGTPGAGNEQRSSHVNKGQSSECNLWRGMEMLSLCKKVCSHEMGAQLGKMEERLRASTAVEITGSL